MSVPDLVLVGGGHAHVQVLRMHRMEPLAARVTLIVDTPIAVYSGMVPGVVAGLYRPDEAEIDAHALARSAGVTVVHAACTGVDVENQRILLDGRPPLKYDLASLNVGSTVAGQEVPGVREYAKTTRPIGRFLEQLELDARPTAIAVVGGGAGGVELAFCLRARTDAPVTLLTDVLLPGASTAVRQAVLAAAEARGIVITLGRATRVHADHVESTVGRIDADLTVWVTGAAPRVLKGVEGWVDVDDTLMAAPNLFAVGDCARLKSWPERPRAGVYAVRMGPVLLQNLRRHLAGQPLVSYVPQRDFLSLLNLGDGAAIGHKHGVPFSGDWVWKLKDRIDRRFMGMFQVLDADDRFVLEEMDGGEMVCGGCAAKVGEAPLSRALKRLPPVDDTGVVMGLGDAEDAVALQHNDELLVTSVDVFNAFSDDAYLVGRVAALNALSDVQAKGVQPRFALAIVQLPRDVDAEEWLFQTLSGARRELDAAGCPLLGGHTTVGEQLSVGFSVTGFHKGQLLRSGALRVGDALALTRPLGTGVLLHADMAGRARGRWAEATVRHLETGNGAAAKTLLEAGVRAVTDVTGFGLVGHLGEMLRNAGLSADISLAALPALPGVLGLIRRGERSTFHQQNRRALRAVSIAPSCVGHPGLELLADPQTAGPLLFGAAPEVAHTLGTVIGRVTDAREDGALFAVSP